MRQLELLLADYCLKIAWAIGKKHWSNRAVMRFAEFIEQIAKDIHNERDRSRSKL